MVAGNLLGDWMLSVVFLQGPLGPFFARLARRLSGQGIITHKINFNGGDRWFGWANHQVDFTGKIHDWPSFFRAYLLKHRVQAVFVYGDCRLYHRKAREVCERLGVKFWVFEEGYLRPDFVTMEEGGVNAFSKMDWSPDTIAGYSPKGQRRSLHVGQTFCHRMWFACCYYLGINFARSRFPYYCHHRNRSCKQEALCWLLSLFRKYWYKFAEMRVLTRLKRNYNRRFFLFPLQVRDDFQLREHADFVSIEYAIDMVMESFAGNADANDILVIKHHPMDRGFCHYGKLISILARQRGVHERVIYCHDLHLPSLLRYAKGVVTINSTVGISALVHQVPTKVTGRALYDIAGLTCQFGLDKFWRNPGVVDADLFRNFHAYIYEKTQLDGCFFKYTERTVDVVLQRLNSELWVEQGSDPSRSVRSFC